MRSQRLHDSSWRLLSVALLATLVLAGCTYGTTNANPPASSTKRGEPAASTNSAANVNANGNMTNDENAKANLNANVNLDVNANANLNINGPAVKTFNLSARNFAFSQTEILVKKGDKVKVVLTSADGFHDWAIDEFNAKTERVNTGATTEVEFTADTAGSFQYYCSVGQHRQMGMVGTLIVE